jgi:hypothetical protein
MNDRIDKLSSEMKKLSEEMNRKIDNRMDELKELMTNNLSKK